MKNILTLSELTIREALSKKIFHFFFGVSTFVVVIFSLIFLFASSGSFNFEFSSSGTTSFDFTIANGIKFFLIYPLYAGGLFLSIFSVSSFIPTLLEKGNIDLILSKPVSRSQVILGKFFGGIVVVFVNVFYAIFALWLLIGLKFDVWDISFLVTPFTITLAFAALYSVIILIGIITGSSMFSMVFSYLTFFVFSPILASRESVSAFFNSDIISGILNLLYYLIPQTSDISTITTDFVVGNNVQNFYPILTSIIYIILILYLSITIFKKKDF